MHYVTLFIVAVIILLCAAVMSGCAPGVYGSKTSALTCLGFCTSVDRESKNDVYKKDEKPAPKVPPTVQ